MTLTKALPHTFALGFLISAPLLAQESTDTPDLEQRMDELEAESTVLKQYVMQG